MKNIFDRLITVIVFFVSVTLASCIVGLMSSGNHAETPWWMLAGLGLFAAISSIGACMWVRINNATVFSSSYKAGVAIHALREQGFDVHQMVIAPVKITRTVEEIS